MGPDSVLLIDSWSSHCSTAVQKATHSFFKRVSLGILVHEFSINCLKSSLEIESRSQNSAVRSLSKLQVLK